MSLKTLSSVLDDVPRGLPDGPQRGAASEPAKATEGVKPEKVEEPKPEAKAEAQASERDEDDEEQDEGQEESDPVRLRESVAKLKKSLRASRGESKQSRKQQQETERKLAMLEGHFAALRQQMQQSQAPKPPEPKPEDLEDEFWKNPTEFINKRLTGQRVDPSQMVDEARIQLSAVYAQQAHPDYVEKITAFAEAVKQNPSLTEQARKAPSPAEFAYREGAKHLALKEIGDDPVAWRQKQLEKLRAEPGQVEQNEPQRRPPVAPTSIATKRGTSARGAPSGRPRHLRDVIG
jgi:hypothetical protein